MIRRLAACAAMAIGLLSAPALAAAAEGTTVGIRPADPEASWLELTLAPGEQARTSAVVVNLSERRQRVRIGAADATTTADGVFTLAGDEEPVRGVGGWLVAGEDVLDLGPGERREVSVAVRVPAAATPGDHAGGLVARPDEAVGGGSSGGVAVRVVERVGLRVLVTVPGRRDASVAVDGLAAHAAGGGALRGVLGLRSRVETEFTVRNAGNVRYDALHGVVELVEDGRVRESVPVEVGALLPGASRSMTAELPLPRWSPGRYRARVRIGAEPPVEAGAEVDVGAARVLAAGGTLAGILGLGAVGLRRRLRRVP